MKKTKLQYIHRDIHDWRKPIEVEPDYIKELSEKHEITEQLKKRALKGEEIIVRGYRLLAKLNA